MDDTCHSVQYGLGSDVNTDLLQGYPTYTSKLVRREILS